MDTMFENLDFRFDKENNDERPFMIACKDREIMDGERWVLVLPPQVFCQSWFDRFQHGNTAE